jgi:hypothetical protein
MKPLRQLIGFLLAAIPAAALAQQPAACQRVEFSEDVLARFPNIRDACLDVIEKDGQQLAVVKADLVRATARRMHVRVKLPDGSHSELRSINVKPGLRLNINGRQTPIEEVAIGQELTAYVHVTDPGIALAPAEPTAPVELTPVPAAAPAPEPEQTVAAAETPEMPQTAGPLPLVAAAGVGLLAFGAGLAWVRRRISG